MDFIRRLFRTTKRSFSGETWTSLFPSEDVERALLEHNKEWVFIAVDHVARAVSAVRFKVMRYSRSGDDEEMFEGPLVDFLESPSRAFTGKDFIYLNTVYKELTGNAFWELEKGNTVLPLVPTQVRPIATSGKLVGYKYHDDTSDRTLSLDNVLHDRYIDPKNPYWGVGRLQKIARWVETSGYSNEFLRLFFVNGAQFGGFIETEEESEERIKLIRLGLQTEHVGVANAHKIGILPKGSKFSQGSANLSDMQFKEMDDQYRDKILAAFGVPKSLVGLAEQVQRGNVESSEYIFAKYRVKPAVDDLIEFLNTRVAPLFDKTGRLYFAYDDFLPENVEMKIKERESALAKLPYKTINEVRAEVGLPPADGGDVLYQPNGTFAIGEKPPAPRPVANDNQPAKAMPRRARMVEQKARAMEGIVTRIAETVGETVDLDAVAHKAFVGRVSAHEELLAGKVRDFNNRQEREVVERVGRIAKAVSKSDIFDQANEVAILIDFVTPLLKGLFVEQAIEEYRAQGFEGDYDQNAVNIARIVELAAKRLAESYNDTTATLLKTALNEGIAAGDGIAKLTERIRSVYEYSNTVRAEMVARTESFYIANKATQDAYRQSGVVKSLRWYTAEDERVCEFCGPMHGRTIDVNGAFFAKGETLGGTEGGMLTLDYRTIDVPPLHTNCRCFVRPGDIGL